jgi:hypothetical protein
MDPIAFYPTERTRIIVTRESPGGHMPVPSARFQLDVLQAHGEWVRRMHLLVPEDKLADFSVALAKYRARHGLTL